VVRLGNNNSSVVVGRGCVLGSPDTESRAAVDFFTTMITIHHLSFGYGTHAGATGGNRLVMEKVVSIRRESPRLVQLVESMGSNMKPMLGPQNVWKNLGFSDSEREHNPLSLPTPYHSV